jgi:hypothetical protein
MRSGAIIHVRLELEGEYAERFRAIKNDLGLKQNTEVIRSLIKNAYSRIQPTAEQLELEVPV